MLRCLLVARKKNLTGVSTDLTGRSKNIDHTGNPSGQSTRPVLISDLVNQKKRPMNIITLTFLDNSDINPSKKMPSFTMELINQVKSSVTAVTGVAVFKGL